MNPSARNRSGENAGNDQQLEFSYPRPASRMFENAAFLVTARRLLNSLLVGGWARQRYWKRADKAPEVRLTCNNFEGSLDLLIINRSATKIWVEEANLLLHDVETGVEIYTPAPLAARIREMILPSESLHFSLITSVYNMAGRPQGIYSCTLSTVVRYSADEESTQWVEVPLPTYRVRMSALVPMSLCRIGRQDKVTDTGSAQAQRARGGLQSKLVRRSQRVAGRTDVVVEGRSLDGNVFTDSTRALVLSAHGCLVTLPKLLNVGQCVVLRNVCTQQQLACQVVFVGKQCSTGIETGLGFETESPDFWGITSLPSMAIDH